MSRFPSPLSGFSFSGSFLTHFACMSRRSCCFPGLCRRSPFLSHTPAPPRWPPYSSGSSCYYPHPGLSPKLQSPLRLSRELFCLCVTYVPLAQWFQITLDLFQQIRSSCHVLSLNRWCHYPLNCPGMNLKLPPFHQLVWWVHSLSQIPTVTSHLPPGATWAQGTVMSCWDHCLGLLNQLPKLRLQSVLHSAVPRTFLKCKPDHAILSFCSFSNLWTLLNVLRKKKSLLCLPNPFMPWT